MAQPLLISPNLNHLQQPSEQIFANMERRKFNMVPEIKTSCPVTPSQDLKPIYSNQILFRPIFNLNSLQTQSTGFTPRQNPHIQHINNLPNQGPSHALNRLKSLTSHTYKSDFKPLLAKRSSFEINESTDESHEQSLKSVKSKAESAHQRKGSTLITTIKDARMEIFDGKKKAVFHYAAKEKPMFPSKNRFHSFNLGLKQRCQQRNYRGSFHIPCSKTHNVNNSNHKCVLTEKGSTNAHSEISDKGIKF